MRDITHSFLRENTPDFFESNIEPEQPTLSVKTTKSKIFTNKLRYIIMKDNKISMLERKLTNYKKRLLKLE